MDVMNYSKALEYALLHFHKDRMVHVNKTIKQLWQAIYRGNDVDYIEIKTEETTSTASSRRSYEYKVMQVGEMNLADFCGVCYISDVVILRDFKEIVFWFSTKICFINFTVHTDEHLLICYKIVCLCGVANNL